MNYGWTQIFEGGTEIIAPFEEINPYENWEKVTRPDGAPDPIDPEERWQPVYVELQSRPSASLQASAQALLDAEMTKVVAIGQDSRAMLREVVGTTGSAVPEHLLRFFVFRPEGEAYSNKAKGQILPYRVIEVGPAIPGALVDRTSTPPTYEPGGGRGVGSEVVTAVIDDIMGIANERFRDGLNSSRFQYFWAQGLPRMATRGGGTHFVPVIGTEWSKDDIDDLLKTNKTEEDFYRALFPGGVPIIFPSRQGGAASNLHDPDYRRPMGFAATHGTHVADLAAGYPLGSKQGRPIVGVQLPQLATFETWGARLDLFILMGVQRILRWADNWPDGSTTVIAPVVINISYGTLAGPKDGSGFLEAEITRLVGLRNALGHPTAVVLPTGNGYRAQTHAKMRLATGQPGAVTLRVQPEDLSVSFLELWLDGLATARLTIAPPVGAPQDFILTPVPQVWDWTRNNVTVGRVYVQPRGTRTRVIFALCPTLNHADPAHTALPGPYELTLTNDGTARLTARFDVQRDDTPSSFPIFGRQAYLDHETVDGLDLATQRYDLPRNGSPIRRAGTLSALATGTEPNVIIVGGAFDRDGMPPDGGLRAALYAGAGPTAGRRTPDLAAVSEETRSHPGILATGTFSGSAAIFTGTSTAAPQVTRAIVDQWSATSGVTTVDLDALVEKPIRPPPHAQLGRGLVDMPKDETRPARRLRN